ncbi:MAG TPA: helix-turn-helix domain-containing protein [Terriglobia bacterium]|nr:helix-turn-helix domain-containing protein [Terriglobia bacterium]
MILRKSKENGVLQVIMTNFGASFKQARESRGISLDQIATETRISTRFLSAIENEDFQLLPGGIFNRGFVRAYAEKIGLDPDQAVADYERLAEVHQPEVVPVPAPPPVTKDRRLYPLAVAALALVIVIFYVVTRESGHTAQTASSPTPAPVNTPAVPTPTPAPAPTPTPSLQPPATAPQTTSAAPEPATPPPTTAPAAPTPVPVPSAPAAPPSGALTLEMEAREQTWVKIVADGKTVSPGEILEPGMTRKFAAANALNISIGNAGGLSLKLNDKPMKPLGKSGQVRELTITPDKVKDFTQ